jgi:hypothetical protein
MGMDPVVQFLLACIYLGECRKNSLLYKKCPKCMASLLINYVNNALGPMSLWIHYLMETEKEDGINIKV